MQTPPVLASIDAFFCRYWGQDGAGNQQSLSYYCQDSTVDIFPLAFLYQFQGTGGLPVVDFANVRPSC